MPDRPRFHLAFPVDDLSAARRFYVDVLGARVGRTGETWIDFDFWDHQISAHLVVRRHEHVETNEVDHDDVPVRHFGVILSPERWRALRDRLEQAQIAFLIEPRIRFEGQPGEQATLFVQDPSGNALEFKSFGEPERVFAT